MAKGHNLETMGSIMKYFQILDLDSEIFGFPIAKIIPDKLSQGNSSRLFIA